MKRKVKHIIPFDDDLVETIPEGLEWEIVGNELVIKVPKYPADGAFVFIEWCAEKGIEHKWQDGRNL
ncbi:MAG: hypothetical protein UV60_C0004G0051 [Parcubacteria group bacterium GW2011_GWA2_43_11]|nr:MAG: hypothetical protein UU89_C0017G0018 [Parcubacteria group bacterium GW2011_GWC2_42_11]KKS85974.1 MAG: hypothetical protein UV60_C0004G0051 [Parcubacteria group bacterium GW2011_GWA2_43_11]